MPVHDEPRARFPYLPLYVDDWLTSDAVDAFSLEQQAAYLRLLLRQWKSPDGMLPRDEPSLARLSQLGDRWRDLGRPIVARCFVARGGRLLNLRCHQLWKEARAKSASAKRAAQTRWKR